MDSHDLTVEQIEALLRQDPSPQTLVWCLVLEDIAQSGRPITAAEMHPRLMEFATEVQATRLTGEMHAVKEADDWAEGIKTFKQRRKFVLGQEKKEAKKAARKANVLQLVPKPEAG